MSQPLWKRVFDAVERESGPALTKTLANPDVIELITIAAAVRKRAQSDLAEVARRGLHVFNLPAGTDISKVSQQVAGLEREIRQLNRRIEELQGGSGSNRSNGAANGSSKASTNGSSPTRAHEEAS
ncbi:MAG: hypothetical protein R2733_05800 [Acidimicrobiales bacterium]